MKKKTFLSKKIAFIALFITIRTLSFTQNITTSQILYWVGTGTNESIFVVYFDDELNNGSNHGFAWGYRWNGVKTVQQMICDIDAADSRIYFEGQNGTGAYVSTITFEGHTDCVNGLGWTYTNSAGGASGISNQPISNGSKIAFLCYVTMGFSPNYNNYTVTPVTDPNQPYTNYTITATSGAYGTISPSGAITVPAGGSQTYIFTPNTGYHAGNVMAGSIDVTNQVINNQYTIANVMSDTTIDVLFAVDKNNIITTNDILYWVGTGTKTAILVVNWCNPEIAFAWGYRFNDNNVMVSDVLEAIKNADNRFNYEISFGGWLNNITYNDNIYNLSLYGNYWMYNINEEPATSIEIQIINDGDVIEFGDEACGILDDFWNIVWTVSIIPVSSPTGISLTKTDSPAFVLYPNATASTTTMRINELTGNTTYKILDMNGKTVFSENINISENFTKTINVSNLAKGIYFVSVNNFIQKLIVY